jgi:hypothetical protein
MSLVISRSIFALISYKKLKLNTTIFSLVVKSR